MEFDENLMIPDKKLSSINEGAIQVMGWQSCKDPASFTNATLLVHCPKEYRFFSGYAVLVNLPKEIRDMLIHGNERKKSQGTLQGTAWRRRV